MRDTESAATHTDHFVSEPYSVPYRYGMTSPVQLKYFKGQV
jgi:hypothetical protein